MFDYRAKVLTMASIGALIGSVAACDDPVSRTDLRTEGAPDILSVLVFNDQTDGIIETATFCKTGDLKRPALVGVDALGAPTQVCPDDLAKGVESVVTDAVPLSWYTRIQFDQLLDPDVEDLIANEDGDTFTGSIAATQPVTLKCGGKDIPYDGYYLPNGNNVSWPVGPSLFVKPSVFVATSTSCEVTVKDSVVDKEGKSVDANKRGPFKLSIAQLTLLSTDPAKVGTTPEPAKISTMASIILAFNAPVDPTSIDKTKVKLFKGVAANCTGGTAVPSASITIKTPDAAPMTDPDPTLVAISDATATPNAFAAEQYRLEFSGATLKDVAGGTGSIPDSTIICISAEN
jgi:hypothetical protein